VIENLFLSNDLQAFVRFARFEQHAAVRQLCVF
jgi:hypothetical protein